MPKRGEKATHRVRYTHANGMTGTHPAYSLDDARYFARTPLSREGCTATIEVISGRGGEVIESYTNLDDLQAVIDGREHADAVRVLATARAARSSGQAVEDAQAAVDATLKRGPGRPAKEGGRRIHLNLDGARLAAVDAALTQERRTRPKASRTAVIETLIDEALTTRSVRQDLHYAEPAKPRPSWWQCRHCGHRDDSPDRTAERERDECLTHEAGCPQNPRQENAR